MEKQAQYTTPEYELPSYLEKVQSQLPALQLLMQLGWQYLTPEETVELRSGRLGSAILELILADHIRSNCRYEFKGNTQLPLHCDTSSLKCENGAVRVPSGPGYGITIDPDFLRRAKKVSSLAGSSM